MRSRKRGKFSWGGRKRAGIGTENNPAMSDDCHAGWTITQRTADRKPGAKTLSLQTTLAIIAVQYASETAEDGTFAASAAACLRRGCDDATCEARGRQRLPP